MVAGDYPNGGQRQEALGDVDLKTVSIYVQLGRGGDEEGAGGACFVMSPSSLRGWMSVAERGTENTLSSRRRYVQNVSPKAIAKGKTASEID